MCVCVHLRVGATDRRPVFGGCLMRSSQALLMQHSASCPRLDQQVVQPSNEALCHLGSPGVHMPTGTA